MLQMKKVVAVFLSLLMTLASLRISAVSATELESPVPETVPAETLTVEIRRFFRIKLVLTEEETTPQMETVSSCESSIIFLQTVLSS